MESEATNVYCSTYIHKKTINKLNIYLIVIMNIKLVTNSGMYKKIDNQRTKDIWL